MLETTEPEFLGKEKQVQYFGGDQIVAEFKAQEGNCYGWSIAIGVEYNLELKLGDKG